MKRKYFKPMIALLLPILMNQPLLPGMNPFGVAYFASALCYGLWPGLLAGVTLLTMSVVLTTTRLIEYSCVIIAIGLMYKVLTRPPQKINQHQTCLVMLVFLLSGKVGYEMALSRFTLENFKWLLLMTALELLLACATYYISYKLLGIFFAFKLPTRKYMTNPKHSQKRKNDDVSDVAAVTRRQLQDFSEAFKKLSESIDAVADDTELLNTYDYQTLMMEVEQRVCQGCGRYDTCWQRQAKATNEAFAYIFQQCAHGLELKTDQVPNHFGKRCIHQKGVMEESQRQVELVMLHHLWQTRLEESRQAMAGQFKAFSDIIGSFTQTLGEEGNFTKEAALLKQKLRLKHLDVKKIQINRDFRGRLRVLLQLRNKKGRCLTLGELNRLVSQTLKLKVVPMGEKKAIVPFGFQIYEFMEDVHYMTLQGLAALSKAGTNISGDCHTVLNLETGQTMMALADGAGSGEGARRESERVIGLMEEMLSAGFARESAAHLLNTVLGADHQHHRLSSMDLTLIDLYTGQCECLKIGAAKTFIKQGSTVLVVDSQPFLVGTVLDAALDSYRTQLKDGDMILMVSDGVLQALGTEALVGYFSHLEGQNPQLAAEGILDMASNEEPGDDMTVLVCGVYKKQSGFLLDMVV